MIKIAQIAGIVMAVHLVIFLVVVQPGCQTRPTAPPSEPYDEDVGWDDPEDFEPETDQAEARPRAAPRRPVEDPLSPADEVADDVLTPLPSDEPSFEPEPEGEIYQVRSGDSLWAISQRHDVSMRALMDANRLTEDSTIQPGQELVIPGGAAPAPSPRRSVEAPDGTTTYEVQSGDSLSVIAQRHGTTVSRLRELNNLSGDLIREGQELVVPENGVGGRVEARASGPADTPDLPDSGERHVVQAGETPGAIANRYGVSVNELMAANNISDPRRMREGQELIIPGAGDEDAGEPEAEEPAESEEEEPVQRDPTSIPVEPLESLPEDDDDDEAGDIPVIPIIPDN